MPQLVGPDGSKSARLVLLGEAPGQHEAASGRPFVGPAGMKLRDWWGEVGLQRSDFYIDNVYPYRPPNNKLEAVPRADVEAWVEDLHERLAQLDDPWLIVPTGNTALKALTGRGRWPWELRNAPPGITAHRGSIYHYEDRKGRSIKVIPTIHPAAVFRQASWEGRCVDDWRRISVDANFRDLRLPEREHFIKPSLDDIKGFVEQARSRASVLAVDIETPRERSVERYLLKNGQERFRYRLGDPRITCVGFSYDPAFSITIPTTLSYWQDQEWVDQAWAYIRELCALPCAHAGQNFLFDRWWLAQPEYACSVSEAVYDTRWMDHCLNPTDDHDLGYQASLHTREPYWKDDCKGTDDLEGEPTDIETYYRYNGKDACVTRELVDVHVARLEEAGRTRAYERLYVSMFDPMLATMLEGMRVDTKAQKRRYMTLIAECVAIQEKLTTIAGEKLYGKKDLSRVALQRFLHETLKLPRVIDRKTHGVTVKEVAIRRLMLKYPEKLGRDGEEDRPGPLILTHRRKFKVASFIKEGVVDADNHTRCSYGFVDTLRLNSGKNPRRSGNNHQNQDRELLDLFLPRPGHIVLEPDLSQAESRIVNMLTRSKRLIERARAQPWENDDHDRAGAVIFHPELRQTAISSTHYMAGGAVSKLERYLGKRCRHAGNYGMHGMKLSEELLKEGYTLTPEECQGYINFIVNDDTPEVLDWQRDVRMTVLRDRALSTTWGYTVSYDGLRLTDELYRSAYAMVPQSECTTILNQWGWVPLYYWIRATKVDTYVMKQHHDSIAISVHPSRAWETWQFVFARLNRPRVYLGKSLTIPVGLKMGRTLAATVEFKRPPTREEFEAAIANLQHA